MTFALDMGTQIERERENQIDCSWTMRDFPVPEL
jgi:hypothetical protein